MKLGRLRHNFFTASLRGMRSAMADAHYDSSEVGSRSSLSLCVVMKHIFLTLHSFQVAKIEMLVIIFSAPVSQPSTRYCS